MNVTVLNLDVRRRRNFLSVHQGDGGRIRDGTISMFASALCVFFGFLCACAVIGTGTKYVIAALQHLGAALLIAGHMLFVRIRSAPD